MNRKNTIIMAAAILLAVGLLAAGTMLGGGPSGDTAADWDGDRVVITVDGEVYATVPLDGETRRVTVTQDTGEVNVIEVDAEGAVMLSSTCENQTCVNMGKVTRDNWEWRVNGAFIICLPNRVSIELEVNE